MEAKVIAIGPFSVLRECDVLLYPTEFYYRNVPDEAIVIGILAHADTRSESETLAFTCNVEIWDLGHHEVTEARMLPDISPFTDTIGEQRVCEVYDKLVALLDDGVDLWFIPIG